MQQSLSVPSNSWSQGQLQPRQRPHRNRCLPLPFGHAAAWGASHGKPNASCSAHISKGPPCPSASWRDPQGSGACLQPHRPVQPPPPRLQALTPTAAAASLSPAPTALGPWPVESSDRRSSHQGEWDGNVDHGGGLQEPSVRDSMGEVLRQTEFSQRIHQYFERQLQQPQQHETLHHILHSLPDQGQQLHPTPHSSKPSYHHPSTEQRSLQGSTIHSGSSTASICNTNEVISNVPTPAHLSELVILPPPEEHAQQWEVQQQPPQQQGHLVQKQQHCHSGSGSAGADVQAPMPLCNDPYQQPMQASVTRFVWDGKEARPSAADAQGEPPSSALTAPPSTPRNRKVTVKSRQASRAQAVLTKPAVAASTLQQKDPAKAKADANPPASSSEEASSRSHQRPSKPKQSRRAPPIPSTASETQHTGPQSSRGEAKGRAKTGALTLEVVLERHALPPSVSRGLHAAVDGGFVSKYITPPQLDKLLHRVLDAGEDLGVSTDTLHTVLRRHPNVLLKQPLTVLKTKAAALKELLGCADEAVEGVKQVHGDAVAGSASASTRATAHKAEVLGCVDGIFELGASRGGNVQEGRGGAQQGGAGTGTAKGNMDAQITNSSGDSSSNRSGGGDCGEGEVGGDTGAGSATRTSSSSNSSSSSADSVSEGAAKSAHPPISLSRVLSVVPCLWGYRIDTVRHKLDSLASMLELPEDDAAALARRCPTLLICAPDSMEAKASLLQELTGMPRKQVAAMVVAVPQLLFLSQTTLAAKFHDMVDLLGVGEQEVVQMVCSRPMLLTSATDTLRANWEELSGVASRSVRWRHELHHHLAPSTRAYLLLASKIKTRRLHYLLATGAHTRTPLNSVLVETHEQFCVRYPEYKRWSPAKVSGGTSAASVRIAALKQRMASSSSSKASSRSDNSSSSSSSSSRSSSSSIGSGSRDVRPSNPK